MKKSMLFCFLLFFVVFLSSCAPRYASWHSSGGSKADGVVKLSFDMGGFINPPQDGGLSLGKKLCQNWGYSSAEPFSSENRICTHYSANGLCLAVRVEKLFQCID